MVWLLYTPENNHYLVRRWSGKFDPRFHLFDHNGVFEFEPELDTVAQVLWAYAMRMGVDLIHVYESAIGLFNHDPARTMQPDKYDLLKKWMSSAIVQLKTPNTQK